MAFNENFCVFTNISFGYEYLLGQYEKRVQENDYIKYSFIGGLC